MVVWRRPCSDGEIIEAMENFIVANCTLGFFVSGLPSTNTMFKKMKLSCVDLFLFSVSDSMLLYGKRRGNNMLIKGQQCFIP